MALFALYLGAAGADGAEPRGLLGGGVVSPETWKMCRILPTKRGGRALRVEGNSTPEGLAMERGEDRRLSFFLPSAVTETSR